MPFCSYCGTEVAADTAACPTCGHPQGRQPAGPVAMRRTDGQAVASLVLGIASFVVCPLIPAIIAIVLGMQAKARIAADPSLDGEGLAKAGVILGWANIVFVVLAAVVVVAFLIVFSNNSGIDPDFTF